MKTVWRYKVSTAPLQLIEMPAGAEILFMRDSSVYALVEPENAMVAQPIVVVRPGEPLPPAGEIRGLGAWASLSGYMVVLYVTEVSMVALKAFEADALARRAEAAKAKAKASPKKPLKSDPEEDEDEDE